MNVVDDSKTWDLFISYASEDREAVAAPLAQLLKSIGVRVWFDQSELTVGDSLRERIDHGLGQSRYGVAVLSEAFFGKHWPTRELNGLAQREVEGEKVILPIWFGVDAQAVRAFSPPLADRVALSWTNGLVSVALALLEVVRPDISRNLTARAASMVTLTPIDSGHQLAHLAGGAGMFVFFDEPTEDKEQLDQAAEFLQELKDWGEAWPDIEVRDQLQAELSLHEALTALKTAGWSVFGALTPRKIAAGGKPLTLQSALVAVVRGNPPVVLVDGDRVLFPRESDDAGT